MRYLTLTTTSAALIHWCIRLKRRESNGQGGTGDGQGSSCAGGSGGKKTFFLSGTGKGNFCKSAAGWQGNTVSVPG